MRKTTSADTHAPGRYLALLASAALLAVGAAHAQTPPDRRHASLRCDPVLMLCLLMRADKDSDGDGYSDLDERAAGSDPFDANSQPRLATLLKLAGDGTRTSLQTGRSAIVIPPTHAPDGRPLATFGVAGLLASQAGFPARVGALQRLGIDPSLMARLGIPSTSGAVLMPGDIVGAGIKASTPRAGNFTLMRLRMGQMAAGPGDKSLDLARTFFNHRKDGPNADKMIATLDRRGDTMVGVNRDGSSDSLYSAHRQGKTGSSDVDDFQSRDADGNLIESGRSESTTTVDKDGRRTTTLWMDGQKKGADGSRQSYELFTTKTSNPDGSSESARTYEHTTQNADGTRTVTKSSAKSKVASDGTETTSEVERTTTVYGADGKVIGQRRECEPARPDCPAAPYVNPDAIETAVIVTAADLANMVALLRSKVTNQGTTLLEYLDPSLVSDPRDISPYAWYDSEGQLQAIMSTPDLWNRSTSSTQNFGQSGSPIDINFAPPGEPPLDTAGGQAFVGGLGAVLGPLPWR